MSSSLRLPLILASMTAVAVLARAGAAEAHFILKTPDNAYEQSALGDPQKAPPCGDNGGAVPTGAVTAFTAGDKVTITINETIFHPGHYRIALALNDPSELPEEPPVTPNNTPCGTVPIMDPPVFPVLADGVFPHDAPFGGDQVFEVTIPADVECTNCTLQVIQFMSNHGLNNPGGCFYHHCATISVQAGDTTGTTGNTTDATSTSGESTSDGTSTSTTGGSTTTDTSTSTTGGSSSGSSSTGTGSSSSDGSTSVASTDATASTDASASATSGDTSTGGSMDESGCGCTSDDRGDAGLAGLAGLLVLVGVRRRSRRG